MAPLSFCNYGAKLDLLGCPTFNPYTYFHYLNTQGNSSIKRASDVSNMERILRPQCPGPYSAHSTLSSNPWFVERCTNTMHRLTLNCLTLEVLRCLHISCRDIRCLGFSVHAYSPGQNIAGYKLQVFPSLIT